MKCPKCQSDNREEAKFCGKYRSKLVSVCSQCNSENPSDNVFCDECGAEIRLECPKCGAKIPLDRKFCGECGHNLTIPSAPVAKELSFDEEIHNIHKKRDVMIGQTLEFFYGCPLEFNGCKLFHNPLGAPVKV